MWVCLSKVFVGRVKRFLTTSVSFLTDRVTFYSESAEWNHFGTKKNWLRYPNDNDIQIYHLLNIPVKTYLRTGSIWSHKPNDNISNDWEKPWSSG